MQPNTLTRREYKDKIYVKNIKKNSCRIRNRIRFRNQLKSRIRIRKNHSRSTTLLFCLKSLCCFHILLIILRWLWYEYRTYLKSLLCLSCSRSSKNVHLMRLFFSSFSKNLYWYLKTGVPGTGTATIFLLNLCMIFFFSFSSTTPLWSSSITRSRGGLTSRRPRATSPRSALPPPPFHLARCGGEMAGYQRACRKNSSIASFFLS